MDTRCFNKCTPFVANIMKCKVGPNSNIEWNKIGLSTAKCICPIIMSPIADVCNICTLSKMLSTFKSQCNGKHYNIISNQLIDIWKSPSISTNNTPVITVDNVVSKSFLSRSSKRLHYCLFLMVIVTYFV